MPLFVVKQRLMSFGDDFDIRDSSGNKVFFVDGKAYSFTEDLHVKDMAHNKLARIRKRLMSFLPTYDVYRNGQLHATVSKKIMTFRPQFKVTAPGADLTVVGSLMQYNFKILRNGNEVAKISKKLIAVRDSYGVEIGENQDHVLLLSIAIIIDMCLHGTKKK